MRLYVILILLIVPALSIFSQALRPTLLIESGDTLLCFKAKQAKALAKLVLKGQGADSIARQYETAISLADSLIVAKKAQLANCETLVITSNRFISNQAAEIALRIQEADCLRSEVKRQKWQKRGFAALAVLVALFSFR